jgi:hypothetical protein
MATKNVAIEITNRLIECGVKIISLPGGFVQLLGMYSSILLTNDITAIKTWQLDQLCGVVTVY